MKVSGLFPVPTAVVSFDLGALLHVSDACGCYALTNASGDIIYVGQAKSLRSRLRQHLENGRHNALTVFGRVSLAHTLYLDQPSQLNSHERGWLNLCELADGALPPLNRVHAPT